MVWSGLLVSLPVYDTNIATLVTDLYRDPNYSVILVCCYSVNIHLSAEMLHTKYRVTAT